jgi:hypothetical protein
MGWGYGHNNEGREIGYNVEAKCDEPGCHKDIDRGLSYACGGMHDGDEFGCGKYFCSEHLYIAKTQLCEPCNDKFHKEHPTYWKDFEKEIYKLGEENE